MGRWQDHAACRGLDPQIFFPDDDEDETAAASARSICATCRVREACLEYAVGRREPSGVWGGATDRERRRIIRRRRRAA